MSSNSIHADRARTRLVVIRGLAVGLALLARSAEAQSPTVYDDGLTRINVGTGAQTVLRDNPNPPPNPTTVILLDGFSLGPGTRYLYRLEGSSVLDIRGGMLTNGEFSGSVDLYDGSRLLMSGGSIRHQSSDESLNAPAIRAGGSSRTEISGGSLAVSSSAEGRSSPGIGLRDNAVLSISGGEFTAFSTAIIESEGASHVTISDGTFDAFGSGANEFIGNILTAYQSSVVDILGGTFESDEFAFQDARGIDAVDDAVINIRGGRFNFPFDRFLMSGFHGFRVGNGQINVFGDNFALDGSPVAPGFIPRDGRLTGLLADGTPLDVLATGRVFLIPEPAAWLLAAAGLAAAAKRRKA